VNVLAMPVLVGMKTAGERFPGATNTLTCEGMMGDTKALQMGTSHELGQNFSRIFDILYNDDAGQQQLCWTTSWGVSTRMMGGLIMAHGDDNGLVVPPALASTQCVVLLVKAGDGAGEAAAALTAELRRAGITVGLDDRVDVSFGRRATDWELKGIPLRVEVGPRDLAAGNVTIVRRDTGAKEQAPLGLAADRAASTIRSMQAELLAAATKRRDDSIVDCTSLDEVRESAQSGFARVAWAIVGEEGEADLAQSAVTVRCLQRSDGSVPDSDVEPDLIAYCARAY
jgi:prolyl-tRNA synthetase